MKSLSLAVPVSGHLARRMGGISGVARSVIMADLAGATTIYLVPQEACAQTPGAIDAPPDPRDWPDDWGLSFAVRGLAAPHVLRLAPGEALPAGTIRLPDAELLTPQGIDRLVYRGQVPLSGIGTRTAAALATAAGVVPAQTPAQATRALLVASLKPGEGWVGRHLNRPISFVIAQALMKTDISPNVVTWLTFVLALVTALVAAHGGVGWLAAGGILYQTVSVIDCVDGDLARVTYRTSKAGAALDTTFDMVANLGAVLGLTVGVVRTYGMAELVWPLALFGAMSCGITAMALLVRFGPRGGSFDVMPQALAVRLAAMPRLRRVVLIVEKGFKRDVYALAAALFCVFGFAWLLPRLAFFAALIWIAAIAWCAPLILRDKDGLLLPRHLRLR